MQTHPASGDDHGVDVLAGAFYHRKEWSTKLWAIGADAMDTWSRGLERFNAAQAK